MSCGDGGNIEVLGAILSRIYAAGGEPHKDNTAYNQAAIHLLQCFGIDLGYSYKWYGRPYSSRLFDDIGRLEWTYTGSGKPLPTELEFLGDSEEWFGRFLSLLGEAGHDPEYMRLLTGIMHVRRCYEYTGREDIEKTLARGMDPTGRYDEAYDLLDRYGLIRGDG